MALNRAYGYFSGLQNLRRITQIAAVQSPISRNLFTEETPNKSRSVFAANEDVPTISFPHHTKYRIMKKNMQRRKRAGKNQSKVELAKPAKVYISSSNTGESMFNHDYVNKFKHPPISMSTWTSNKRTGEHFKIHAVQENPSRKSNNGSKFAELLECENLAKSLRRINIKEPTTVQAKVLPAVISGNNVMFAAETGSGKTYSYLLPIIKKILDARTKGAEEESHGLKAIVVVPTRELVTQVTEMAELLKVPLNFLALHNHRQMVKANFMDKGPDVVISTPAAVRKTMQMGHIDYTKVRYLVVDECDTLLDDSFSSQTKNLLSMFNVVDGVKKPLTGEMFTQLIMCSATFPEHAREDLSKLVDLGNMLTIKTGYLHRIASHVTHRFYRVSANVKCERAIEEIKKGSRNGQTIVFCNHAKSSQFMAVNCSKNGIPAVRCDGSMDNWERGRALEQFHSGQVDVLIATDLLSRGINTPRVGHVLNYEVPHQVSDYLHRSGRVGRIDSKVKNPNVTTLASKKWEVEILKELELAARKRTELQGVDANISRRHKLRHTSTDEPQLSSL